MILMIRNLYRYLVAVALISVLAAVAGCSSSTAVQGMIETPVFVGVSLHEAEAKAAEAGVQVEVQSSESSDTIPVNFILRQNPEPQTIVRKGRVITVVTSSGPVSLTLPDFVGGKFEVAQAFIVANQLVLGDLVERVDASPVGTVLAQKPAGNADVDRGSVVTLTVSRGTMATNLGAMAMATEGPVLRWRSAGGPLAPCRIWFGCRWLRRRRVWLPSGS